MRLEKVGLATGDGAVLDQQRIKIKGCSRTVGTGDPNRGTVGHYDGRFLSILIQAFDRLEAIPVDTERNEKQGGIVDIFSFRVGVCKLLYQALRRKLIGRAASQQQGHDKKE